MRTSASPARRQSPADSGWGCHADSPRRRTDSVWPSIRSAGGRDPVGSLWVAEADSSGGLAERLVVDARELVRADADLPPEEKARRERMRETTAGITAFSADDDVTRAVFSIDGVPFVVDLAESGTPARELPHPGPVVDPRISPDGTAAAFVSTRSLYVVGTDGSSDPRLLGRAEAEEHSWGLADFVAAEELDRVRGLWWLAGSSAVLAEHVDESPVAIRWISDPAQPETEPKSAPLPGRRHRESGRPGSSGSASTATGREIDWDHEAYPYLATVQPDDDGGAVISVLSRDQRRQLILDLSADGGVRTAGERVCTPWITMQAGVPCRGAGGELLEIVANTDDDCFQLLADGQPATPAHLIVTGLVHAAAGRILVTAQPGPMDQGGRRPRGRRRDTADARRRRAQRRRQRRRDRHCLPPTRPPWAPATRLVSPSGTAVIASLAETPVVEPVVTFLRVTDRELACAVLWPTGHVPGSRRLPVVMAPYGGPHHARVVHCSGGVRPRPVAGRPGLRGRRRRRRRHAGPRTSLRVRGEHRTPQRVLDDQVAALQALGGAVSRPRPRPGRHHGVVVRRLPRGPGRPGPAGRLPCSSSRCARHGLGAVRHCLHGAVPRPATAESRRGMRRCHCSTRAEKRKRPLLIIHGLADDNVARGQHAAAVQRAARRGPAALGAAAQRA